MCDLAGSFTCFESFTKILCIYLFFEVVLSLRMYRLEVLFNSLRIGDTFILKNKAFLDGVHLFKIIRWKPERHAEIKNSSAMYYRFIFIKFWSSNMLRTVSFSQNNSIPLPIPEIIPSNTEWWWTWEWHEIKILFLI